MDLADEGQRGTAAGKGVLGAGNRRRHKGLLGGWFLAGHKGGQEEDKDRAERPHDGWSRLVLESKELQSLI